MPQGPGVDHPADVAAGAVSCGAPSSGADDRDPTGSAAIDSGDNDSEVPDPGVDETDSGVDVTGSGRPDSDVTISEVVRSDVGSDPDVPACDVTDPEATA